MSINVKLVEYVESTSQELMVKAFLDEEDDFTTYLEGYDHTNDGAIIELKQAVNARIEALQNIDYSTITLIPIEDDELDDE